MNITKSIVNSNNWMVGRENNTITGVVLHTEVGTNQSAQARFNDPASQVSVHYGVELDGSIRQWVDEKDTAYQAGNWDVNLHTIGVEHSDNGNANDSVRTPQLYEASSDLVADICKRYNIPCDSNHILLHKNVIDKSKYPGGTACPDGLDTNKIITLAYTKIQGDEMPVTKQDVDNLLPLLLPGEKVTQESYGYVGKTFHDFIYGVLATQAYKDQLAKSRLVKQDVDNLVPSLLPNQPETSATYNYVGQTFHDFIYSLIATHAFQDQLAKLKETK